MLQKNQLLQQERFRVVRQISHSLHGMTYEAFDNILKTNVILREICAKRNKILTAAQIAAQKTVIAEEVRVLTEIKHDSILRVYDYFSEADRHYLVTEFVEGNNFNELLRKGSDHFSIFQILKWSDELLNAVSYLHSHSASLIHGNIKPENIILTANGKIKLLPFGISPTSNPKKDSLLTEQEFDAANLHYSPLEQIWTGLDPASRKAILNNYEEKSARILEKPLDAQTDIYALGATLYHLFTKSLPIDPLERSIDMLEGKTDPLLAPGKLNPTIPPAISEALLKTMQIKRENRFESAVSMQKILHGALLQIQTQESLKTSKYKDDEDLLEINTVEQKTQKPRELPARQKDSEIEVEQKRQFELIKKQLQEAEAQRLKAEQRAVEAEKLLLEKKTEPQPPENQPQHPAKNETINIPAEIETPQTASETAQIIRENKTLDADSKNSASVSNSDPLPLLFNEPPKDNKLFKRMAAGAFVLALLGGAGWGVFNFAKTTEITPAQTVSLSEPAKPTAATENSAAVQNASPVTTAEADNNSIPSSSNIQTAAETNNATTAAESKLPAETVVNPQTAKNKSAAPPTQRPIKQTPTPPKIAAVEKKPITVDDIISDN